MPDPCDGYGQCMVFLVIMGHHGVVWAHVASVHMPGSMVFDWLKHVMIM